jgi:GT2 family glycosyltransferase
MRASIVVATHNEGDLLWRTARSCMDTLGTLDGEVVVADDASSDGSIEALAEHCDDPRLRVVSMSSRQGVSRTKDLGGRAARGEVILFLDGHTKPEPGAVQRLVEDVEDWEGEAIVSPRVVVLDTKTWENNRKRSGYAYRVDLLQLLAFWLPRDALQEVTRPSGRRYYVQPAFAGCTLALTKALYERLGGFDTGMLSYGYEDLEFGMRAWLSGVTLVSDPVAVIGHLFRTERQFEIPAEHYVMNELRMARRIFGEDAWSSWLEAAEARTRRDVWPRAMELFEATRAPFEQERARFHATRPRDEFAYAAEFGLAWPLVLAASPFPVPAGAFAAAPRASTGDGGDGGDDGGPVGNPDPGGIAPQTQGPPEDDGIGDGDDGDDDDDAGEA